MAEAKKNLMTYEGLQKLEAELEDLKTNRRKANANDLKEARAQGDLSENAEYEAAKPYIAACYGGMGRAISGLTRWDPDESRDLCMSGTAAYRSWCFEGVVRVLISEPRKTAGAFDFCASVPTWFENRCFETIGESVPDLYADTASRNEECEKAQEEEWVAICRRSAGLGGWSEDEKF